jgi:hypothetical protein
MNKNGQSIIEYTLIAILVILGIVYMGPYALRSVNAYFKLWDEGVQDSFEENLSQAPVNVIPDMNATCQCWTTPGGCGGISGASCQAGYRSWAHSCNPQGSACDGGASSGCSFDTTCCDPIAQSCGSAPLPLGPGNTYAVPSNTTSPPCYYGQRIWISPCSISSTYPACSASITTNCIPTSYCVADAANCPAPKCTGNLPSGALYCTTNGAAPAAGLLDKNYPVTQAPGGTCPSTHTSPGTYCYYYFLCPSGSTVDASGNCAYEVAPAPVNGACPTGLPSNCSCPPPSPTSGYPGYTTTTVTCGPNYWCNTSSSSFSSVCSLGEVGTSCSPQGGTGCANGTDCGCGNPGNPGNSGTPTLCALIYNP